MHIQPCHIQNPVLFRTRGIFKSLTNMKDNQTYSKSWHIQNNLFKHFQGYLGIFRDIDAYSATLTCGQLGRREQAYSALFKNWKKCPDFGTKSTVARRKTPNFFPVIFLMFLPKCLSKCCSSTNFYLRHCPEKFLVVHSHSSIILFAKRFIFWQRLTVFWIRLSLGNCSVNCTVTLYYILDRTHSE